MADNIYIARQPVKNIHGKTIGYELLYRGDKSWNYKFPLLIW